MQANVQLPAASARWADPDRVKIVEHQWETVPRRRDVEALVRRLVGMVPHESILDLGCGTARYSELLTGWNFYMGVDESAAMLALAGARMNRILEDKNSGYIGALAQSDIRLWQPADDPFIFDLALCMEVAPHYPDPLGFIAHVVSIHKARYFLVSVEAHDQPHLENIDFKVGEELGSCSVPRGIMEFFFKAYEVIALKQVPSVWHPDAVDWFCLLKGDIGDQD